MNRPNPFPANRRAGFPEWPLRRILLPRCCAASLLVVFLAFPAPRAVAQWMTQTITLRPGWNAVFLEVQPEPRECDAVLSGLPVESVWRWNKRFTTVQFIQDPNQLLQEPDAWLVWIAPGHQLASQSSLHILEGGLPYLIKITNNSAINWSFRGRPVQRRIDWLADSLNLVGFGLPTSNPPTYQTFFAGAAGLTNSALYRMDSQGRWIATAASTPMQRGEAFWIQSQGQATFAGPVELQVNKGDGVEFGQILVEQSLRLRNASSVSRTVTVRLLPSESPLSGAPELAGPVPLSIWQQGSTNAPRGWTNLPVQVTRANLSPGEQWELRLAVRRRDLTNSALSAANGSQYQSLLEVTDGTMRCLVPVTAESRRTAALAGTPGARSQFAIPASPPPTPHPKAGLWIGTALLNKVSQPSSGDPTNLVPTASGLPMRLIVHVNSQGQAVLLQRVMEMWKDGTLKPAPDGSTNMVLDQPGRLVLVTDEAVIPQFTGSTLRDGQPVARRFSSAAFAFGGLVAFSGSDFGVPGGSASCVVSNDYRDPLNPFVHIHHPDHNNFSEDRSQLLPEGTESFTVVRQIQFKFATRASLSDEPAWDNTQVEGVYCETIRGLHKSPLHLEGLFKLTLVSQVAVLNQ